MKKTTNHDLIMHDYKSSTSRGVKPVPNPSAQTTSPLHGNSKQLADVTALLSNLLCNDVVPEPVKAVAALMFEHGLRISEVLRIEKKDISPSGHIRIKGLKGSHSRVVLAGTLRTFWTNSPDYMFPIGDTYSRFYFYRWFRKMGVYKIFGDNKKYSVTHLFRHALALQFKEDFNDTQLTQKYLGHKNIKSTEHYEKKARE